MEIGLRVKSNKMLYGGGGGGYDEVKSWEKLMDENVYSILRRNLMTFMAVGTLFLGTDSSEKKLFDMELRFSIFVYKYFCLFDICLVPIKFLGSMAHLKFRPLYSICERLYRASYGIKYSNGINFHVIHITCMFV
jgi:hypothetical protein